MQENKPRPRTLLPQTKHRFKTQLVFLPDVRENRIFSIVVLVFTDPWPRQAGTPQKEPPPTVPKDVDPPPVPPGEGGKVAPVLPGQASKDRLVERAGVLWGTVVHGSSTRWPGDTVCPPAASPLGESCRALELRHHQTDVLVTLQMVSCPGVWLKEQQWHPRDPCWGSTLLQAPQSTRPFSPGAREDHSCVIKMNSEPASRIFSMVGPTGPLSPCHLLPHHPGAAAGEPLPLLARLRRSRWPSWGRQGAVLGSRVSPPHLPGPGGWAPWLSRPEDRDHAVHPAGAPQRHLGEEDVGGCQGRGGTPAVAVTLPSPEKASGVGRGQTGTVRSTTGE